ncbi:hypothetical protein DM02DRAFT_670329 [Periconia macrospinosa]|uniref:Uncharacterized protein n=1 Tax=Periconia macrospinosa TaxID=97972 RepID=A0A2V1DXX7_9PLEO|nr:hypothetical protein DM02DRAFT_670329 [Periconia macrospinosa]
MPPSQYQIEKAIEKAWADPKVQRRALRIPEVQSLVVESATKSLNTERNLVKCTKKLSQMSLDDDSLWEDESSTPSSEMADKVPADFHSIFTHGPQSESAHDQMRRVNLRMQWTPPRMVPLSESERQETRKAIATAILAGHFEDLDELKALVSSCSTGSVETTPTYPTAPRPNTNSFSSSAVLVETPISHTVSTDPAVPRPDTDASAPRVAAAETPKAHTAAALPTVPDVETNAPASPDSAISKDHLPDAESPETGATEYDGGMDESWDPNPDVAMKEEPIVHAAQDEMAGVERTTEEAHIPSEPPTETDMMLDAEPQPSPATAPTDTEIVMPDAAPQSPSVTAPSVTAPSVTVPAATAPAATAPVVTAPIAPAARPLIRDRDVMDVLNFHLSKPHESAKGTKRKTPDSAFDEFQDPKHKEGMDTADEVFNSVWQSIGLLRQCTELYTRSISRPMGEFLRYEFRRFQYSKKGSHLDFMDYLKDWLHKRLKTKNPNFNDTKTFWVVVEYLEKSKEELSRGQYHNYREWLTESLRAWHRDLLQVRPVEDWHDNYISQLRERRMEEVYEAVVLNNWMLARSYDPTKANQVVRVMTFDEIREEVERADASTFRAATVLQTRESILRMYGRKTDARKQLWERNPEKCLQWLKQNVPGAIQAAPALASASQAPKRGASINEATGTAANTPPKKRRGDDD